jgi:CheY-like chemotaxis protein
MTPCRILHVDDEPDIRDVVELSLALDPRFTIRSCASGEDAVAEAADWLPDLILCDVMMPVLDGPATLARLRADRRTADIPLIFMTARLQTREVEHFKSLGATGVIAKPFDPTTLAESVRDLWCSAKLAAIGDGFAQRLRADAATLVRSGAALRSDPASAGALEELRSCAHKLAGGAGIFGYRTVSCAASALEDSAIERSSGRGTPGSVEAYLGALLDCIENEPGNAVPRDRAHAEHGDG